MSRLGCLAFLASAALGLGGCTTGEGRGWVKSEQLFIEKCWSGSFDLRPDFFAALPFDEESLFIRIQRGENNAEVSDGVLVLVRELKDIRQMVGTPIPVGLPAGVSPPGVPLERDVDPTRVSLTLYLHATCHGQSADVYAINGSITFRSLFSGNVNEPDAEDRLTEAEFSAEFADPRKADPDGTFGEGLVSRVEGYFRFYFQRGQPAQPFL
jgi:hypothetical protein